MKFDIWFFRKFVEEIQVSLKPNKNNGTSHEAQNTFLIISRLILLKIRSVSEKIVEKIKHTHCVQQIFFLENRALYEIMWKNIVQWGKPQTTIWRMRIAS
jgi:hypothetical protein